MATYVMENLDTLLSKRLHALTATDAKLVIRSDGERVLHFLEYKGDDGRGNSAVHSIRLSDAQAQMLLDLERVAVSG